MARWLYPFDNFAKAVFIFLAMAKGLVKLLGASGDYLIAASQHKDVLKLFKLKKKTKTVKVSPDDVSAILKFKNGKVQKKRNFIMAILFYRNRAGF